MTQQIPRSLMAHACLPLIFAVSSVFLLESRWNLVSDRNENLPSRCERLLKRNQRREELHSIELRRMHLTWPASNEGCHSAHQNSIDMVCSFACLLICERIDYWMSCSSISQHEIWTSLSWRRLIVCNLSLLLLLRYRKGMSESGVHPAADEYGKKMPGVV